MRTGAWPGTTGLRTCSCSTSCPTWTTSATAAAARAIATGLLANAETRIIYRQETDQLGPTAQALGLTAAERARLPFLGVGEGLWKIRGDARVIQNPLHNVEAAVFDTTERMT